MVWYTVLMKIKREIASQLDKSLSPGSVSILYGPRQVGKTTLVKDYLAQCGIPFRFINADELRHRRVLESQDSRVLKNLIQGVQLLAIDEAQRVKDIGLNLKILVDTFPSMRFIATGSASFELANKVKEPLTGRTRTLTLFPVSYEEYERAIGGYDAFDRLEDRLIWGGYPKIVSLSDPSVRTTLLQEIVGSYLYRDILELVGIRHADKLTDLLQLLAFQIGQEVSLTEISSRLSINRETVERYLDLLEKVFVIFKIRGYSRNLRTEITHHARYYFFDIGVRNAIIQNFNPLSLRNDVGQLWENFCIVERMKYNAYLNRHVNRYFWRTYDQKEVDYVEEINGQLFGYECTWGNPIKKSGKAFVSTYPHAKFSVISRENIRTFISSSIHE